MSGAARLVRGDDVDLSATIWARVILSVPRDIWCLVDAEDLRWITLKSWNWGWHVNTRWKFYAKRNTGAARSTVYLHREIMLRADPRPIAFTSEHVVDHINGQSLDNRRCNLRWATKRENNANSRRREQIPSIAAIAAELARQAAPLEAMPF